MYVAAGLIDTGNAEGAGKRQAGSCSCSGSDRSRIAQGTGSDLYTLPQCGGEGLLPAVTLDEIKVEQQGNCYTLTRPLVAVVKQPLSPKGEYEVLIQEFDGGAGR